MRELTKRLILGVVVVTSLISGAVSGADRIQGEVKGGGSPIAHSTVILWEASAGPPRQLAQTKTDNQGRFKIRSARGRLDTSLYLVATGGEPKGGRGNNPAISLLAAVGSNPPAHVVIDEMTTIASVVTHMQFIDGQAIQGSSLALRIAAGNVPNLRRDDSRST